MNVLKIIQCKILYLKGVKYYECVYQGLEGVAGKLEGVCWGGDWDEVYLEVYTYLALVSQF